jgi:uncharacterized protein (DUF433 family)
MAWEVAEHTQRIGQERQNVIEWERCKVPAIHCESDQIPVLLREPVSMAQFERITFDPGIMGGKACIRGLRVTVGTVLGLLAVGRSRVEILEAYPYLESEDIDES